jgi:hypothetical protein
MNKLMSVVRTYLAVRDQYETARDLFRSLNASDDAFLEARQGFYDVEPQFEQAQRAFELSVNQIFKNGRLRIQFEALDKDNRFIVLSSLRDVELEKLLEERNKSASFLDLIDQWKLARSVYEANKALFQLRLHSTNEEFDAEKAEALERFGEGGATALTEYDEKLEIFAGTDQNSWDAVKMNLDETRRVFEIVCEDLIEAVVVLRANGQWEYVKRDMDILTWRSILPFIEERVVMEPQRQLAEPETMREVEVLTEVEQRAS